jgi:chemosensory pili system protein ChpC
MSTAPDQVYAVLVQVLADTLLIPNLAVADVVPRIGLQSVRGSPQWFDGVLNWQGRKVPVARFEVLNGAPASAQPGRRARVLILNATGSRIPSGVFGILTESHPHLVTLNRVALQSAALRDGDRADLVVARARIANQEAAIPNFDRLENELAGVLDSQGS